jgi:predicted naringenin-chalcone synthase
MSRIISVGTAVPQYKSDQSAILSFMSSFLDLDSTGQRKLNAIYHHSNINTRYSVIPDYSGPASQSGFFKEKGTFTGLDERMQSYHYHALPLANSAIEDCIKPAAGTSIKMQDITHLITVSCTGFSAPGLDIELIHRLGLSLDINRTSINFMGCYAAFHALKLADAYARADEKAVVLVVCVELCTIHFQPLTDDDNLVANSLFSDGAAAVLVTSDKKAAENKYNGLHICNLFSAVSPDGQKDMAWRISANGFLMTLSSFVPGLVEKGIMPLAQKAVKASGINMDNVQHWAIHPGGKKILEASAKALGIDRDKLKSSFNVLQNFGNMSSSSILFVLKDLWNNHLSWKSNENIFAAGFGPGLTIESGVFSTVVAR